MPSRSRLRCAFSTLVFAAAACSTGGAEPSTSTSTVPVASVLSVSQATVPASTSAPSGPAPVSVAAVLDRLPHDAEAFTEGLLIDDGVLVESTGLNGSSEVRRIELASGEVQARVAIPREQFGEGVAILGDELFELTWTSGIAHVYDRATLRELRTIRYQGEGWGLAADGTWLVMSDGSDTITWRDPVTFEVVRSIRVHDDGAPVDELNELEFVGEELWANVWHSSLIARIDPTGGRVIGWVELGDLRPPETESDGEAVANGIAFDADSGAVYVTGKRWDTLYRIEVPAA